MIKVDILRYKRIDNGALRGNFTLCIYPQGQKILDCKYFIKGEDHWFSFPQKQISDNGYIPLVSYIDKEYLESLKSAVIKSLKVEDAKTPTKEKNGPANNPAPKNKSSNVDSDAPPDWL